MPLDPQVEQILAAGAGAPAAESLTVAEARAGMARSAAAIPCPDCPVATVDVQIPVALGTIPGRVFTPELAGEPLALTVFFHGGGWVMGDLETHDALCRQLADATRSIVVAADYRLAPEHRFPTAAEDAYAATIWAHEHARELGTSPERLAVAGDSAGGNLATVVSLMARDRRGPALGFQLLICPITDCNFDTSSYLDHAQGYGLTRTAMRWFFDLYATNPLDPHVSPLRVEDLSGLPRAYVITAEFDPLRDEGEAYARRLEQAGVAVRLERYDGMYHSFLRRTHLIENARRAWPRIREEMEKAF